MTQIPSRKVSWGRPALVALLAALVALPPGLAQAAAPRTRDQREADARKACAAGRVDEGIEILADLYASYSHPNYIYNQGRCYQENGKPEPAISRFREYLRVATDAPADVRERVERFIKELEGERQGPPPPPPPRDPLPSRPMPPPPSTPPPTVTQTLPPAPAPTQSSPALQAAAIAFGVVGAVGLVGAVLAGAKVSSLQKDVEGASPGRFTVEDLADHESKAHRFETLQWVGYGVAGVGLVGALICVMANRPSPPPLRASRFTIAGLPGGQPGLAVAGKF
jgi:hypothetical protein